MTSTTKRGDIIPISPILNIGNKRRVNIYNINDKTYVEALRIGLATILDSESSKYHSMQEHIKTNLC